MISTLADGWALIGRRRGTTLGSMKREREGSRALPKVNKEQENAAQREKGELREKKERKKERRTG